MIIKRKRYEFGKSDKIVYSFILDNGDCYSGLRFTKEIIDKKYVEYKFKQFARSIKTKIDSKNVLKKGIIYFDKEVQKDLKAFKEILVQRMVLSNNFTFHIGCERKTAQKILNELESYIVND